MFNFKYRSLITHLYYHIPLFFLFSSRFSVTFFFLIIVVMIVMVVL